MMVDNICSLSEAELRTTRFLITSRLNEDQLTLGIYLTDYSAFVFTLLLHFSLLTLSQQLPNTQLAGLT